MANIMITEACNIKCSYCFANEFVCAENYTENKKNLHMTIENFERALNFVLSNRTEKIGIIGGEPTVHPQFKEIIEKLIFDSRIQSFTLFTNGINIENYYKLLSNNKIHLLVNCNSPKDIGKNNYEKMVKNLDTLILDYYMQDRVILGINMYKEDFDYEYILELLDKYKSKVVRVSITVPNTQDKKNVNALEHFHSMKEPVFKFFKELYKMGVTPHYDCNIMPICVPSSEQAEFLKRMIGLLPNRPDGKNSTNIYNPSKCEPVIDILPNLQAVRCFALSDQHKVHISKFRHINQLRNYFFNYFDSFGFNINNSEQCGTCDLRQGMQCSGGCLACKIDKITKAREYCYNL